VNGEAVTISAPNRLGRVQAFLRVSLIVFVCSAILGGILAPSLWVFPAIWGGNLTVFEALLWPVIMVGYFVKLESGGGLIIGGALGYGLLGWMLGITIWGIRQVRDHHPNP